MEYITTCALPAFVFAPLPNKVLFLRPSPYHHPLQKQSQHIAIFTKSLSFGWCKRCALAHVPGCIEELPVLGRGEQAINPFTCTTGGADWTEECVFTVWSVHKSNTDWKFGFWCRFCITGYGGKIKTKLKLFSRLGKQTLGLSQAAFKTGWKALEIAVYNGFVCNSSFQWNTDDSGTSYHQTYLLRIQMY